MACLGSGQAGVQIFFNLPLKVILQFFVEFLFHLVAREECAKPEAYDVDPTHCNPSYQTARTICEMAVDRRSHWADSCSIVFRPALVNV